MPCVALRCPSTPRHGEICVQIWTMLINPPGSLPSPLALPHEWQPDQHAGIPGRKSKEKRHLLMTGALPRTGRSTSQSGGKDGLGRSNNVADRFPARQAPCLHYIAIRGTLDTMMSTARQPTSAEWYAHGGVAMAMVGERRPELLDGNGDLLRNEVVDAMLARCVVQLSDRYQAVS